MDRLFDFLNSRNPLERGFKRPISATDLSFLGREVNKILEYLFTLKTVNNQLLFTSGRKTFIVGFACAVKSVLATLSVPI